MDNCQHEFQRFTKDSAGIKLTGMECVKCKKVVVEIEKPFCDNVACHTRKQVEGITGKRYCSVCLKGL